MLTPQAGIQVDKFYPPTDWLDTNNKQIDIRKGAEDNTIVLLYGHSSDLSKYSLLGFVVAVSSGTYDVYIDDVKVGDSITSNTQYDVDFSTINTSYGTATTPESLVLHKIIIKPTTEGATITLIHHRRTAGATGSQQHGTLWYHFELENNINLNGFLCSGAYSYTYSSPILLCLSAKGDVCKTTASAYSAFSNCLNVEYLPKNNFYGNSSNGACFFKNNKNKRIRYLVGSSGYFYKYTCSSNFLLEQIENSKFIFVSNESQAFFHARKLKVFPNSDFANIINAEDFMPEAYSLYPTKFDFSKSDNMNKLTLAGSSTYPSRGVVGLKLSPEAPFSGSSPQIDVSYTGLDRDALVELFNNLPYNVGYTVVGSPTENPTGVFGGFSSSNYLVLPTFKDEGDDFEIAVTFTTNTISNQPIVGVTQASNYSERPHLDINAQKFRWKIRSGVTIASTISFSASTKYKVVLTRSAGVYTMKVYSASDELLDTATLESSALFGNSLNTNLCYGYDAAVYSSYFGGSIDFNAGNTYIKRKGVTWFRGTAATTKTMSLIAATGNNLTAVNSLTVTDGIASGFSASDFIRCGQAVVFGNDFSFDCKIKTFDTDITTKQNVMQISQSGSPYANVALVYIENEKLYVQYNDSTQTSHTEELTACSLDTDYAISLVYKNNKLQVYVNDTLVGEFDVELYLVASSAVQATIGYGSDYFMGTCYMNDTAIKYKPAEVKGYRLMVKGYINDTDKNIALNKGWSLTLA